MNKRIIASVLAVAFAFSMAGPVGAITDEQYQSLLDQFNQLTLLYNQLLAQISVPTPAATAVCFDADLQKGMTSDSVKDLQIKLGVTPTSGYFGPITLAAVKTFQTSNGIINTGYVGPLTRGALNALYCTPVVPTTTTTVEPGTTTTTVAAVEGFLGAKRAASPISVTVKEGESNIAVAAYEVKANLSDITLQRVSLKFNVRPWLYVSHISLYDGSNAVVGVEATSGAFEARATNDYRLHLTGLNLSIPAGTTKTLTVKVSVPTSAITTGPVTVSAPDNGFRGIDSAGLQQYAAVDETRIFTTGASTVGTLEVKLTAGAEDKIVTVSDSAITEKVQLASIGFTAKNSDVKITQIIATVWKNDAVNNLDVVAPVVYLMDGATVLSSGNTSAATSTAITFSDLDLDIVKDATKTLTLKVDVNELAGAKTKAGDSLWVVLVVDNVKIIAEDALYNVLGDGQIIGSDITSKKSYAYKVAPTFSFVSSKIAYVGEVTNRARAEIKFTVTANGGDVYIPYTAAATGNVIDTVLYGNITATPTIDSYVETDAEASATDSYLVPSGETETFVIYSTIATGTGSGLLGSKITEITWNTTTGAMGTTPITIFGFELFKSGLIDIF